jgi:hypothetical protein
MKHKTSSGNVHTLNSQKLVEAQRIESARERSRGFREIVKGERTITRGEGEKTEWGNRVRIVPGQLVPQK